MPYFQPQKLFIILYWLIVLNKYNPIQTKKSMKEKTLVFIKPDAIEHAAAIWAIIKNAGFSILTVKKVQFTRSQADNFFVSYRGSVFYKNFMDLTAGGYSMIAILEKENAVEDFTIIMGDSDPAKAKPGTIRNLYGNHEIPYYNAIHASDSIENAALEINILYPEYCDV